MSDPRTEPLRADPPHDPARPPAAVQASPGAKRGAPSNDIFDDNAPLTDESPTIISKNGPRPAPPPEPEPAPTNDLHGRRLAHFELIEQIGVGGMAAVLRARDTQLDRCVALKILPPDLALDPENVKRFHQEARAAAKLDHDNIARVFFCGEDQRLHFIAFEFVEGENLRTILERRTRLPVTEALPYLIQVVAGLCHAAERGVVHRDIKPSNIIITPAGRAKLVDMGLARSLAPQDKGLTQSGVTLGTFDYISPEQALEPRDADVRSDIYSLGCTFYHMLTGKPPVPEGTPARKLHHHQNVKPIDPRVLAPGLPDDIAIILDRMMAKDARKRYQTADELLQVLVAAARKQGATAAGSPLLIDALLPAPAGGSRLLLFAGLIVAALIGLIYLVNLGEPTQPPPRGKNRSNSADVKRPEDGPLKEVGPELTTQDSSPQNKEPPPVPKNLVFEGPAEALAAWLKDPKNANPDQLDITLKGNIESSTTKDDSGLEIQASKKVILRAHPDSRRPVFRLTYEGSQARDYWAALTINSPESQVEGIRFEVNGRRTNAAPMIGLLFKGGNNHTVKDCEFILAGPYPEKEVPPRRLVSLKVEGRSDATTSATVKDSLFVGYGTHQDEPPHRWLLGPTTDRGLEAIVVHGSVFLDVVSCAFGPHHKVIHLDNDNPETHQVRLSRSTILAGNKSASFEFEGETASAMLDVRECLFSRLDATDENDGPVVIRRKGAGNRVHFQGSDNRYYKFAAFEDASGDRIEMANSSDRLRELNRGEDAGQILLDRNPWPKPNDLVHQLETYRPLWQVFRIDDQNRQLRLDGNSDLPERLVGAECLLGYTLVKQLPPLIESPLGRIVDPNRDDSRNGIYPSLQQAILASKAGDTILIRANGDLVVPPLPPLKDVDLTIRPDKAYRPVLVLEEGPEACPALFRLFKGKLRLEGLEIRLSPQKAFKSQSVVAFTGDGQCQLKDCLITLDQAGQETALSLATLPDGSEMMKTPRPSENGNPRLTLDGCFLRGDGDLVASWNHRPFDLEIRNGLAVLRGSLLAIQPGSEAPPAGQGSVINVKLEKVTTYLGGPLLAWRAAKEARGLTPVQIRADNCAFLPASSGSALVRLDVSEGEKEKLKEKLLEGRNACGSYASLYDQPSGSEMNLQPLDGERWRGFTLNMMSKFRVKLAVPPAEAPFCKMTSGQFKLLDPDGTGPDGFGVDLSSLQKRLPPEPELP